MVTRYDGNRAVDDKQNKFGKGVIMQAVVMTVEPADREARIDHIRPHYLEALTLVERLHRRLLDVIKDEFDRRGRADINSVQALLRRQQYRRQGAHRQRIAHPRLLSRLSNVSYNLKKLVETGFPRSPALARRTGARCASSSPTSGREVGDAVDALYQEARAHRGAGRSGINTDEFSVLNKALHRLERFWTDQILYRQ